MTVAYEVEAIAPEVLKELRHADDAEQTYRPHSAEGGEPLRCCLRKGVAGESLLLVSYAPLLRWAAERPEADPGPYLERGPVFIHADECDGPAGSGYPMAMHGPQRVLRTYTAKGRIAGGRLIELGPDQAPAEMDRNIKELLADPEVALIHVRAVVFGCFLFEVRRA
jgi:hypothetical protein